MQLGLSACLALHVLSSCVLMTTFMIMAPLAIAACTPAKAALPSRRSRVHDLEQRLWEAPPQECAGTASLSMWPMWDWKRW